ncbi:DNA-binding response regulator [Bacillus badius]|nr:DNA-binding response regulator [Bacillus badius]
MRENILLIEDDPSISDVVSMQLTKEGYAVTPVFDGLSAIEVLGQTDPFDLILLDLMLPGMDGLDCLKKIRETSTVPVLILSAKDGEVDKALGLGFGADDYITKPFSMIELAARVKALIRRATLYTVARQPEQAAIEVGDLLIHSTNFSVQKRGVDIKLTAKEFQILNLLAAKPERVFTKAQLYTQVWNEDYFGDENVINVHIRRLREKIEDDPSAPRYIQTVWGIGYKLGE